MNSLNFLTEKVGTLVGSTTTTTMLTTSAGISLLVLPCIATGPIILAVNGLGWAAEGVGAGTIAAGIQAGIGNVGAGTLFAGLQSLGAGGYAAATLTTATQGAGAVVAGLAAAKNVLW